MERVRGIGGVFFKARDPKGLGEWYAKHLGIKLTPWGGAMFPWKPLPGAAKSALTVWSLQAADTADFGSKAQPYMINYQVAHLEKLLAQLRAAGATVDDKTQTSEYGSFGWATDPEGNRFELWQPPRDPAPRRKAARRKATPRKARTGARRAGRPGRRA